MYVSILKACPASLNFNASSPLLCLNMVVHMSVLTNNLFKTEGISSIYSRSMFHYFLAVSGGANQVCSHSWLAQ